jgi:hypothetical protein
MAGPSLQISSTEHAGFFTISQVIQNGTVTGTELVAIHIITNDASTASPFVVTALAIQDADEKPLSKHDIGSNILSPGLSYHVLFRYTYKNGTILTSNALFLALKNVPNQPSVSTTNAIRPEDGNISINPALMGFLANSTDGFSTITKMIVYVSKVGSTSASDLVVKEVAITKYDDWYPVCQPNVLINAVQYEVAVSAINSLGSSPISSTVLVTPADVPSEMPAPKVFSLLSNQKRKGELLSDNNGDSVIHWERPSDYDNLITNNKRVTKYVLTEQEYEYVTSVTQGVSSTSLQAKGSPSVTELLVPAHPVGQHSGASFELQTPEFFGTTLTQLQQQHPNTPVANLPGAHHYRHVISGSASRIGKIFKVSIAAVNVNGSSPVSVLSSEYTPFILPNQQPHLLTHNSVEDSSTGTPLTLYDGKMKLSIAALASVNGGEDFLLPNVNNTVANPIFDVELELRVREDGSQTNLFNSRVRFIQKTTSTTTGTGEYQVTTHTGTGSYELDFDHVYGYDENKNENTLNSLLVTGKKYEFAVSRVSKDPWNTNNIFSGPAVTTQRTRFESPPAVKNIQVFAANDDLTTVSTVGQAALRLAFEQVLNSDMKGFETFPNRAIEYRVFQNSSVVANLDPMTHDPLITGVREFIVNQSSLGTSINLYLRAQFWNPELNQWISAYETSPVVSETSFLAPPAVTGLKISKPNANSLKIEYVRQQTGTAFLGNTSATVQNRILLLNTLGNIIGEQVIAHNSGAGNTHSHTFPGLTVGATHIVFVIAERLYTKAGLTATPPMRFNGSIIRSNYVSRAVVTSGTPSFIRNVEFFPSSGRLELLFDEPANFMGLNPELARAHFFLNEDSTDFPALNVSVADVSGSSNVILTHAFRSKLAATARANALPIRNDTPMHLQARIIGTVGGHSLTNTSFSHPLNNNFNGLVVETPLPLVVNALVPEETVEGEFLPAAETVMASDSVPTPVAVIEASDSKLKVVVDKDNSSNVSELIIIIDNNDGLDAQGQHILAFDTRPLKSNSSGGLFILEQYINSPGTYIPPAGGPTAITLANFVLEHPFTREIVGGATKYNIEFNNLVNGQTYEVNSRFARFIEPMYVFSPSSIISRAPEAPPTVVRQPSFEVDSTIIKVAWLAPLNSGGAGVGGNGPLQYRVNLFNSAGNRERSVNTSSLTLTLDLLTNNTEYKVTIGAFYVKSDGSEVLGNFEQANQLSGHTNNLIRVNPAPLPPTVSIVAGDKSISGSITAAIQPGNLYTLESYRVSIRHKSNPTLSLLVQTINNPSAGSNYVITAVTDLRIFGQLNLGGHEKPLNGFAYEVVVESVPAYSNAQAPPSVLRDAQPAGPVIITNITNPHGLESAKAARVVVNLNGSGPIQNIVALAKGSSTSPSIVVQNLSGGTLPVISPSGVLDNTAGITIGQIATFDLVFSTVVGNVSDILVVVATPKSSDAGTAGSHFGNAN